MAFFVLLAVLAAQPGGEDRDAGIAALDQYQWRHRLILVFASSPKNPRYLEQQTFFAQTQNAALAERDLLIFSCFASGGTVEPYALGAEQQKFGAAAANKLRSTFGATPDEFQVVLVGKDGSEKRRSGVPVAAEDFLAQIDSMPMWQQEMQEPQD